MTIGILGPSYCGSTLIGSFLGQLPRVCFLGETHWLADEDCAHAHDWWYDGCGWMLSDVEHAYRSANWYPALSELFHSTLVVSDKLPEFHDKLGWPDRTIVAWKHPLRLFDSYSVRHGYTLKQFMQIVPPVYDILLTKCRQNSVPAFGVNVDCIMEELLQQQVLTLATLLGLPFVCVLPDKAVGMKYTIGGNRETRLNSRLALPKPLPELSLTARREVMSHPIWKQLWQISVIRPNDFNHPLLVNKDSHIIADGMQQTPWGFEVDGCEFQQKAG